LQELRAVSIELRPQREEVRFRKEVSFSRQPFFLRGQAGVRLGSNSETILRRSNFIYNYCLREEEKLIEKKLGKEGPYLRLGQVT
jgi:hypothetical protein